MAAAALRINASSGPRGSPCEGKRKSTDSHDGNNDNRNPSVMMSDRYIHVHHYVDTGRWGTWFNDPTLKRGSGKRRLYFGTYQTEYLAARAQDRAALKFKPYAVRPITRLNFAESDYVLDKELRDKLTHEQFRRLLMAESRKCYKRAEPSPCWRIFLEEEAAKGNIQIEYMNRSSRYHKEPRTFAEVLAEIVTKDEPVSSEEITEQIDDPVTTGEEEGKVYTAKRTRRPTQAAPNQPAEEVTKELVAEDPALPTRSLSARQVRKATPVAAPPVRHDTRSPSLSAQPVLKAAPPVRRDAKSASLSARQVREASPRAAPPLRHDAKSASLSARQVLEASPRAAPPLRRDAKSASLSARQVLEASPRAAPPLRHDAKSASLSARQVLEASPRAAPPLRRDAKSASLSARQVLEATPRAAPPLRPDANSASLSARQGRKATPRAAPPAPPVHHDTRSASLSAPPVRKATPKAAPPAPPVHHDTRSASLSAPPVRKATPKAAPPAPPVHRDTRSASLSAPPVRKATPKAAPPVLRRDTKNPSQSARPVPKGAPVAAPPVRRDQSIFKRGVRRAEGEGRSALQASQQGSVYLDCLEWGRTRGRSMRNFNNAASTDEATAAADSMNIILMAANIISEVSNGTSGTSDGKVALGSDHTTVENPSKRRGLNIDLNREPEPSSTPGAVASPHESDATGGNDDPEVSPAQTLLLLKAGWLK